MTSAPAPRERRTFAVIGFGSTHDALDAEALLDDMGIDLVPIPAPAALGTLCGIALRIPPEQAERAVTYLERAGIAVRARIEIDDM